MNLVWTDDELRRFLRPVVQEVAAAIGSRSCDDDRLAYLEPEAARLLGLAPHQLRDARLRGEVVATRAGGRIAYEKSELLAYLVRNRSN
jgi:hypothetical protein